VAKLLTSASVLKLKPGSKRIELRDGGCKGLILRIETTGHKTWLMRFRRPNGRLSRLTLGPVDFCNEDAAQEPEIGKPLTLASARRLATEVFRQRAFGHDFVAARERAALEKKERAAKTFDKATIDFIEQHAMRKTRRWQSQARMLGLRSNTEEEGGGFELMPKGLANRWKDRVVADIDGDDIFAIVDETRWKGAPGLARRNMQGSEPRARSMHATLSVMFSWLVQRRRLKMNPCVGVHKPDTPTGRACVNPEFAGRLESAPVRILSLNNLLRFARERWPASYPRD
jgi:Arm DNA-binding domain